MAFNGSKTAGDHYWYFGDPANLHGELHEVGFSFDCARGTIIFAFILEGNSLLCSALLCSALLCDKILVANEHRYTNLRHLVTVTECNEGF